MNKLSNASVIKQNCRPFFELFQYDDDGLLIGTIYFYSELNQEQRDRITKIIPDAKISEYFSVPNSVQVYVPTPEN